MSTARERRERALENAYCEAFYVIFENFMRNGSRNGCAAEQRFAAAFGKLEETYCRVREVILPDDE